jgi:hypothetical protein
VTFTVRVAPSDDPRTVFAVLARTDSADPPHYRIVSLQSAPLPPGQHQVTATLVRPGKVRFEGLPVPLSPDRRTWSEVQAAIPGQVTAFSPVPAHLIIAVELCGPQQSYTRRVDCAAGLIGEVAGQSRMPVRYSLIGYGTHSFTRMTQEDPIEELCWAGGARAALSALGQLSARQPLNGGSADGAKLECALEHVARRLAAGSRLGERPVLVSIGTRPPFPRAVDASSLLPCRARSDWRETLLRLTEQHAGMAFGAIYDGDPPNEAWERLGSHAHGQPSAFNAGQFAMNLGLLSPAPSAVSLPLVDAGMV